MSAPQGGADGAEHARPLSLVARCAFVLTGAQHRSAKPRWRIGNGEKFSGTGTDHGITFLI
jgi:hypothetical protein